MRRCRRTPSGCFLTSNIILYSKSALHIPWTPSSGALVPPPRRNTPNKMMGAERREPRKLMRVVMPSLARLRAKKGCFDRTPGEASELSSELVRAGGEETDEGAAGSTGVTEEDTISLYIEAGRRERPVANS